MTPTQLHDRPAPHAVGCPHETAQLATCDDYRGLLRSVLSDPAADLPRLVLADYLEENGDADATTRARFIRADVRTAALGLRACPSAVPSLHGNSSRPCKACEYCLLRRERWNLLEPWRGVVPACPAPPPFSGGPMRPGGTPSADDAGPWLYAHRGFFWHMRCSAGEFVRHAAAVFASHPIVGVTLNDCVNVRGEMSCVPPYDSWCWRFAGGDGVRLSLMAPAGLTAGQAIVRHGRRMAGLPPFVPDFLTAGLVAAVPRPA